MVELTFELIEGLDFQGQVKNIIKNGDPNSLTAGLIRKELETHYGLQKDALKQKPYKQKLSDIIDETYIELQNEQKTQEQTPAATNLSKEASPVKPSPVKPPPQKKRKASSSEIAEEEPLSAKKAKVESVGDKENVKKSRKAPQKKKQSKEFISDSEDEEMKDASDKDGKEDDEEEEEDDDNGEGEDEDEDEVNENDFSTPPPTTKKTKKTKTTKTTTKKAAKSSDATTKGEESVKRLKQFIHKCGVRKVWAKELKDCNTTAAEIRKLKAMLEELGVHGRPTNEKCEAVKKERELKAELDNLDTTLIINETSRKTRTRNASQSRPSYAVDASSGEEEEEEEEQAGQGEEASADKANESGNESDVEADDAKEESEDEDESSDDEFQGDDSDEDA